MPRCKHCGKLSQAGRFPKGMCSPCSRIVELEEFVSDFEEACIKNMSGQDWLTNFWTRACALLQNK